MKLKIIAKDHLLRKVTVPQGSNNPSLPPPPSPPSPSSSPSPPLFLLVGFVGGRDDQICTPKTPLGYSGSHLACVGGDQDGFLESL